MKFLKCIMALAAVLYFLTSIAIAAIPQTINYQGYLKNSAGQPANYTEGIQIQFALYYDPNPLNEMGATPIWSETQNVIVKDGLFSVILGSVTPIELSFTNQYYLGIAVGTDGEMMPRQALTNVPYSFRAKYADNVNAASITGNITQSQVANLASDLAAKASKGANADITSLTGLTMPLSVAQGGTGSNNGSISGPGALTLTAGGTNTNINLLPNGAGTVNVNLKRITNLGTPAASSDAATRGYVDSTAVPSGFSILSTSMTSPSGYSLTDTIISAEAWTEKQSMPTDIGQVNAAVVNKIIYVMDGNGGNRAYDPLTNTWTTKASMPTPRQDFALAVANNIIYAVGGYNGTYLATNESYDPATDTWHTETAMPTARRYLTAAAVNNRIYAMGGFNGAFLTTNESYDPETNSWKTKAAVPSVSDYPPQAATLNGVVYLVGSLVYSPGPPVTWSSYKYDTATNTWTTMAGYPGSWSIGFHGVAVLNNLIYAVGGCYNYCSYLDHATAGLSAYDSTKDQWTAKASMPAGRYGIGVGVVNGVIYAIGGIKEEQISGNKDPTGVNEAYIGKKTYFVYTKD